MFFVWDFMLKEALLPVGGEGSVISYFREHIDPSQKPLENKCKETALKILLKGVLLSVSAGGNAFFIPLSQKAAQDLNFSDDNLELAAEVAFIFSNLAVVVALEFWCGIPIIEELLEKKTVQGKAVGHENLSKAQKALIGTAILGLALASQAQSAFAGMKYQKGEFKYWAAALILLRGAIWPVRSMHLKLNKRLILWNATSSEKSLFKRLAKQTGIAFLGKESLSQEEISLKQQEKVLEYLLASKQMFIQSEKKQALICNIEGKVSEAINEGCFQEHVKNYLEELFLVKTGLTEQKTFDVKTWALFLGIVAMAALEVGVTSDYTYDESQSQLQWDVGVAGFLAFLVFVTNYDLTQEAMGGAVQKMWSTLSCQNQKSLAAQFHPKLTLALKSGVTLMDLFALGVSYVIWQESKQSSFNAFMCMSAFLIFFTATDALIDSFLEDRMVHQGSEIEKKSVEMSRRYDEAYKYIENIAPNHWKEFFDLLPRALQESIGDSTISRKEIA